MYKRQLNDYSTAVLYYNIDAMEQVGITCISVEREDCAEQGLSLIHIFIIKSVVVNKY